MLVSLNISNLALLKKAQLDIEEGFTTITGETGAGKSILLGAISLLAGNRAQKEILPKDADFCLVEGIFYFKDSSKIDAKLTEIGVEKCEDGQLVISRKIFKDKPAKCSINGSFTTLSNLVELSEYWVDFHGSREPQKLFSEKYQLEMLDSYANLYPLKDEYLSLYNKKVALEKELDSILNSKKLSVDEMDFLATQIQNIEDFNPSQESIDEIQSNFKLAKSAQEILENANTIYNILDGDDGLSSQLAKAIKAANAISGVNELSQSLNDRLNALSLEASDIAQSYKDLADSTDMTSEQVDAINQKMSEYLTLSRKYGSSAKNLQQALSDMKSRYTMQSDIESLSGNLKMQIDKYELSLKPVADKILKERLVSSKKLQSECVDLLKKLGFKKPSFEIKIEREKESGLNCGSFCQFMFSGNPGQDVALLSKVASSGELARVMLALKACFANADSTPLLVFDEVDSNVGGEIGGQVGLELKSLSNGHQVLCVTHLPQVAALADNHLLIEKILSDNSTSVSIKLLEKNSNERVCELARMLGDRNSKSAIAHAKMLLESNKSDNGKK